MLKLCLVLVFALFCNESLSLTLRHKRQATDNDSVDRGGSDLFAQFLQDTQNPCRDIACLLRQQQPRPQQPQQPQPTSSTLSPPASTTSAAYAACRRNCPVTAEYNPVCGTDNVTYDNPGTLACAQACGASVTILRSARCPAQVVSN